MRDYLIILFLFASQIGCTQDKSEDLLVKHADQLQKIKEMPYIPELSGDSLFWVVVKDKIDIIPYLIAKLDDTTRTEAVVPNFGGNYMVADIAYEAIQQIIRGIPTENFIPQAESTVGGYSYYWNYVRNEFKNRQYFKTEVESWFNKNKKNLVWVQDTLSYRTATNWKLGSDKNPAGGYYQLKQ